MARRAPSQAARHGGSDQSAGSPKSLRHDLPGGRTAVGVGTEFRVEAMILNLAALAWNFTLLDPTAQEQMLVKIADLFECPEGMEMFLHLADRTALLFPEEERFICKVETEPTRYGDVALRVASAM